MKKFNALLLSIPLMIGGCFSSTLPSSSITSVDSSNASISSSESTSVSSTSSNTESSETGITPYTPIAAGYTLVQEEIGYMGIPSVGTNKLLVFAVDFSDYPSVSSGVTIADVEASFNGTPAETDYESLASYYAKSSYGTLTLDADVFGFYRASQPSSYYETADYPESELIDELLTYYNATIDYSQYDANEDGYIDGIYVMYTRPYDSETDLWWAYQYYTFEEEKTYDGVYSDYYIWMSTQFLLDGENGLDARTIIHETGHMMGLEDYYDYDDTDLYNWGGLGGADMMDYTVGDHNPFSKLLLGWMTPHVVTQTQTVTIESYESSGDVLLVTPTWSNTLFDEYVLISFYTPTGLYEDDVTYYFAESGITIYHVDAHNDNGYDEEAGYYSMYNNNNTDTEHTLIRYVEADDDGSIISTAWVEEDDLFRTSDTFLMDGWYELTWQNDVFTIEIIEITSTTATVSITRS